MRFTKEVHSIALARLRQLQKGALPERDMNGICADIHLTFCESSFANADGYQYCDMIFKRLTGDASGWPIGLDSPKWEGSVGKDRRAFAGFMADFIEHTYLGDKL